MSRNHLSLVALAIQSLVDVLCVAILAWWGAASFALPWPGLAVALAAPLFAVLLWALFLSPRAVVRLDRFGQALVEIVLFSAAGLALISLGLPWLAAGFVIVAAVLGLIGARRPTGLVRQNVTG